MFFLFAIFLSCNESTDTIIVEDIIKSNYLCDNFTITLDEYKGDVHHVFRVKPVVVGNIAFNRNRFWKNIEEFWKPYNISFILEPTSKVDKLDPNSTIKECLDGYYENGYLVALILPTGIKLSAPLNVTGQANGIPSLSNPAKGKPVFFILEEAMYTNIVNHEIGHTLGLNHTFQYNDVRNKGLNCDSGDGVPDTVTPIEGGGVGAITCKYYAPEDWIKDYTEDEIDNLVTNVMSYSHPNCITSVTEGQLQKIRAQIAINSRLQDAIIK